MNIWLVSIFEQTPIDNVFSTRFLGIADEALNRGHQVTFFGSTFKHNTKEQRFSETTEIQQAEKYQLVFIKSTGYKNNISLKRLWSHYKFANRAIHSFNHYPKPDVVLLAFPPISLAYELTKWCKKHGIPIIIDIIDPWPDIFEKAVPNNLRFIPGLLLQPLKKRVKQTLRRTSQVTAISEQYLQWAKGYCPEIRKSECLYPAADYDEIQNAVSGKKNDNRIRESEPLKVIYAGSLGKFYDIECILNAAWHLQNEQVIFYIAGAGTKAKMIEDYASKLNNLVFLGRMPKTELMNYYGLCDLGTTQHINGATQSVTYKLFELLSAGLPILNSLESEMKDIILENKVGLHNEPGNSQHLSNNILFFIQNPEKLANYKKNSLNLAKRLGDSKVIYNRFVDLLEENANF